MPDWQGTELSNKLGPADPTSVIILQGLMSLLVGQGSERKLRKTGPRRETNLEMLIQKDHQMRQGTGWSLKRFQASDRLGQSDSSEQEAYLARLLGPGVCGMMLRTITPDPMHRITNKREVGRQRLQTECASTGVGSLR